MTATTYALDEGIATITIDDGRVNALSTELSTEIAAQFARAEEDGALVVLTGRGTTLSAGFDIRCPPEGWPEMVTTGAKLSERILQHPHPVVVACNGSAIAMGAFLLLSGDLRIGAIGDFKIGLNEVAIGLTLPWFGVQLARHRLTRPYSDRCPVTGVVLGPEEAVTAGFLDRLVPQEEVLSAATAAARELAAVNRDAHHATKLRVREPLLTGMRDAIEQMERGEW